MPEIILEYSAWWLLVIFSISGLLTLWLYTRNSGFTKTQRLGLGILRFCIFSLLGFLMLAPFLRETQEKLEKPILVWLEDRSQSVLAGKDSNNVLALYQSTESFREQLSDRYTLRHLSFSTALNSDTAGFSAAGTDIEAALSTIRERYYNQNLAGVVLLSDGIYNKGSDPSYIAEQLPFPVYALALGDSSRPKDLLIERVINNRLSYLNNEFPIEVYVKARDKAGEEFRLVVKDAAGTVVIDERHSIDGDNYFKRFNYFITASKEGFRRFTVSLEQAAPDTDRDNNQAQFNVEVISNRKKILLLASAPHPDIAALAEAINSAERYDLKITVSETYEAQDTYDLILLHQPSSATLAQVHASETAYWLFLGPTTNLSSFPLINAGSKGFEESQTYFNNQFDLFNLGEEEISLSQSLPPLWAPFGTPEIEGPYYPLFFKRIGNLKTQDPTLFFLYTRTKSEAERRIGISLGTGYWRWRIHNFRTKENFEAFDGLVLRSIQFLTTNNRFDQFDVDLANRFLRSDRIIGEARLYNASLELINDPEVRMQMRSEKGEEYDFTLTRVQNTYRLNAGSLPAGLYDWTANTELEGKELTDRGKLLIEEDYIELADKVARPSVLRRIAKATNGEFYNTSEVSTMVEALKMNPDTQAYSSLETTTKSLIEKHWPFFLLLVLMAAEWGLRKYFGRY